MTADDDFMVARREAVDAVVTVLERDLEMEPAEALALLAGAGDMRVGQTMGGAIPMTLRLEIPKWEGVQPVREVAGVVAGMIVDVHSHLMWYPDHVGERFAQEALASKLVKLRSAAAPPTPRALDLHSYDSTPEHHWEAAQQPTSDRLRAPGEGDRDVGAQRADRGLRRRPIPDKLVGWASVDPNEPEAIEQLDHAVERARAARAQARPGVPAFRPDRPEALAVLRRLRSATASRSSGTRARRSPATRQAALVDRRSALEDIAHGLPRPADDRRPPGPSVGGGPRRARSARRRTCTPTSAPCHYRPWRYWQAMVDGDGVRRDAQAAARARTSRPARSTTSSTGCGASTTPSRARACPRSRPRSQDRIIHENWKGAPSPNGA